MKSMRDVSPLLRRYGWLLLILLTAVALRLYALPGVPPGLTHDEADHGITAISILSDGVRDLYFDIGYGREPLYDYLTAALMAGIGPTYLAGRLTAVYAGLLLLSALMAWASRAFNWRVALLTGAGLAVSFWPVASSRQGLRSILLPVLFALAVLFFWRGLECVAGLVTPQAERGGHFWCSPGKWPPFLAAGLLLGLSFYTYIPARGLWLIFPALLLYWTLTRRSLLRQMWGRVAGMLGVMLVVALPLLDFLRRHPQAETRILQLAGPLQQARAGDFAPLWSNITAGLGLVFVAGDPAWRYNIPGKPLLGPLWAALLLGGLVLALVAAWRGDGRPQLGGSASFLALAWLGAGLAPVLITGPELGMTQAVGMQPVLYLFPALALSAAYRLVAVRRPAWQPLATAGLLLFMAGTAIFTFRDYFQVWANAPEVRVQYETTLVSALAYIDEQPPQETAVSTITPGRYHSQAVARLLPLKHPYALRWFDGRGALLLPRVPEARVTFSGFAPLAPALAPYFAAARLQDTLPLRATDQDRPVDVYEVRLAEMRSDWEAQLTPHAARLGDVLSLTGYELQTPLAAPGDNVRLITAWEALQPLPGVVLFTHLLGPDGVPLAQADRLDVPGDSWMAGDRFVQLHSFDLPADLPAGQYQLVAGAYTLPDGERLPVDVTAVTTIPLGMVVVQP